MLLKLFLAFTLIPVIELTLLIKIGTAIGVFNTLLLVIVTGFSGAYLARAQGFQTMLRVRERLNRGEMPAEDLIDAVIIFAAGVVLLTPGLLTDITGLLLLLLMRRLPARRDWGRVLILSALNIGVFQALLFVAAYRLPGGLAAVVGAIQPLLVMGLAWGVEGRRPARLALLA